METNDSQASSVVSFEANEFIDLNASQMLSQLPAYPQHK